VAPPPAIISTILKEKDVGNPKTSLRSGNKNYLEHFSAEKPCAFKKHNMFLREKFVFKQGKRDTPGKKMIGL
jgi:hypothetical protein